MHCESFHYELHYSASTIDSECFYYGLHCLVGRMMRLQPVGSKRQAGGTPTGAVDTWCLVARPGWWAAL